MLPGLALVQIAHLFMMDSVKDNRQMVLNTDRSILIHLFYSHIFSALPGAPCTWSSVCSGGSSCRNGFCTCPDGKIIGNGECVSLIAVGKFPMNDLTELFKIVGGFLVPPGSYCSSVGLVCGGGSICQNGLCVCSSGFSIQNGVCVTTGGNQLTGGGRWAHKMNSYLMYC